MKDLLLDFFHVMQVFDWAAVNHGPLGANNEVAIDATLARWLLAGWLPSSCARRRTTTTTTGRVVLLLLLVDDKCHFLTFGHGEIGRERENESTVTGTGLSSSLSTLFLYFSAGE